jgi:DNA-binding transcriptional ArsR family regulator
MTDLCRLNDVFSDPVNAGILYALQRAPLKISELSKHLDRSRSVITRRLVLLEKRGVVVRVRFQAGHKWWIERSALQDPDPRYDRFRHACIPDPRDVAATRKRLKAGTLLNSELLFYNEMRLRIFREVIKGPRTFLELYSLFGKSISLTNIRASLQLFECKNLIRSRRCRPWNQLEFTATRFGVHIYRKIKRLRVT